MSPFTAQQIHHLSAFQSNHYQPSSSRVYHNNHHYNPNNNGLKYYAKNQSLLSPYKSGINVANSNNYQYLSSNGPQLSSTLSNANLQLVLQAHQQQQQQQQHFKDISAVNHLLSRTASNLNAANNNNSTITTTSSSTTATNSNSSNSSSSSNGSSGSGSATMSSTTSTTQQIANFNAQLAVALANASTAGTNLVGSYLLAYTYTYYIYS